MADDTRPDVAGPSVTGPDLTGQVAIVTGAGRGLGVTIAEALAEAGAAVFLTARDGAACAAKAEALLADGHRAAAAACDVSDHASVLAMVAACRVALGPPSILINNAGVIDPIAPLGEGDSAQWARNIQINLVGALHCLQAVLPDFQTRNSGVVVNISSGAAHSPMEGWSAYCAAKAGLAMLTQSTQLEWGDKGVRAYGFAPGTVESDMQRKIRASGLNPVSRMQPVDHLPAALPAGIIAWLCSEAAAPYAGRELTVRDPELQAAAGVGA